MINEINWRRLLYTVTGLVIILVLVVASFVIPSVKVDTSPMSTPESAANGLWVFVLLHLIIVAILFWAIRINKQFGRVKKGNLITVGVILVLLSLMFIDGAAAFAGHTDPVMSGVSTAMFICVGFDFIAGILAITVSFLRNPTQPKIK